MGIIFWIIGVKQTSFGLEMGGAISTLFSGMLFVVASIVLLVVQTTAKKEFEKVKYEKEVLEYRLETEGLSGNEFLYKDIVEFNNSLRDTKYYYNGIWINWFTNKYIAEMDYIEIHNK
jgi:high-affinity nickel permease